MIYLEVRCDICGKVGFCKRFCFADTLRDDLDSANWQYLEKDGKDICPECHSAEDKEITDHAEKV